MNGSSWPQDGSYTYPVPVQGRKIIVKPLLNMVFYSLPSIFRKRMMFPRELQNNPLRLGVYYFHFTNENTANREINIFFLIINPMIYTWTSQFVLNIFRQRWLTWGCVQSSHVKRNTKYKTLCMNKSALFLGKEFAQILKWPWFQKGVGITVSIEPFISFLSGFSLMSLNYFNFS